VSRLDRVATEPVFWMRVDRPGLESLPVNPPSADDAAHDRLAQSRLIFDRPVKAGGIDRLRRTATEDLHQGFVAEPCVKVRNIQYGTLESGGQNMRKGWRRDK
jgi:hypothetical protein